MESKEKGKGWQGTKNSKILHPPKKETNKGNIGRRTRHQKKATTQPTHKQQHKEKQDPAQKPERPATTQQATNKHQSNKSQGHRVESPKKDKAGNGTKPNKIPHQKTKERLTKET